MLQVNVSQLLKEPVGATRNLEIADRVRVLDGASFVSGQVKLIHTNRGILTSGHLLVEVEAECCRCLELFSCPLEIDIEEEYFSTVDVHSGSGLRLPEDYESENFTIDEHHILDLSEAIRQYAIIAIPMKPLCRQDCAGIKSSKEENGV